MYYYNLGYYFNDVSAAHSERPALRYPDQVYSYSELTRLVESLAALLIVKGCRRGHVIAIGHNKRPLAYALMLAALRLGIAYVNIDVASPPARNSRILEVSGVTLLFYDDPQYAQAMASLAKNNDCEAV